MPNSNKSLKERFLQRIEVDSNGCWLWTGYVEKVGYGVLSVKKNGCSRKVWVHRLAYELFVGEIPDGMVIDHRCRMRRCANPSHLEVVSRRQNARRGVKSKRSILFTAKLYCTHGHLLTEDNVYLNQRGNRGCKTCNREQAKRRYLANKERILTRMKENYQRKRRIAAAEGDVLQEQEGGEEGEERRRGPEHSPRSDAAQ